MRVLFTRRMSAEDLDLCLKLGIEPVIVPLITTESVDIGEITEHYPNLMDDLNRVTAVAFTSQHAVDALLGGPSSKNSIVNQIRDILRKKPVYTVGEVTADALDIHGIMARFPDDYNGSVLAQMMQYDGVHTAVMHFCGSERRPEFYEAMKVAGIEVIPVEVYRKGRTENPGSLPEDIDAVAFYSPSAVNAFWDFGMHQDFSGRYFVIGTTTLAAIEPRGKYAFVPRIPTSELLIREIARSATDPNIFNNHFTNHDHDNQ
jgi:uroporphyrinogen-III synthase